MIVNDHLKLKKKNSKNIHFSIDIKNDKFYFMGV